MVADEVDDFLDRDKLVFNICSNKGNAFGKETLESYFEVSRAVYLGEAYPEATLASSRNPEYWRQLHAKFGAIHLEIETDAVDELELASVKKQLKKSMGADYDMGSNSRSASGKEGNADKASGAEVRYETQQSAIKAKAAAAYEGGHTVKVSGGIGSLSPKPTTAPSAAVGQYRCVKKSQIRSGFEMDSAKAQELLEKYDTNQSGEMEFDEFVELSVALNRVALNVAGTLS